MQRVRKITNGGLVTAAQLEARVEGPVEVLALASASCERPGAEILDPDASDSAFEILRAQMKAALESLADSRSLDAAALSCIDRNLDELTNTELAEARNGGKKEAAELLAKVFQACVSQ